MAALDSDPLRIHAPINPEYGSGAARRRIRLASGDGWAKGELCDPFHEMLCDLQHDGERVVAITGAMPRNPTTACPGAIAGLQRLVGKQLAVTPTELGGNTVVREQCTHLFDLAMMTLAQASRGAGSREVIAILPDQLDTPVEATVHVNAELVHRWRIADNHIVTPKPLAGLPLLAGFHRWAAEMFEGDSFEAALVLERTCLIARGRRYRMYEAQNATLKDNSGQIGSCHAYQPERAATARFRSDNYRVEPF